MGAAKEFHHVVCLTLGTGLGAGIIVEGQVMNGSEGGAGEVGHMILYPNGLLCGCGRKGCSEQYVSGTAIRRMITEANVIDPETGQLLSPHNLFKQAVNGLQSAMTIRDQFYWVWIVGVYKFLFGCGNGDDFGTWDCRILFCIVIFVPELVLGFPI